MRVLAARDLEKVLPPARALEAMEEAFRCDPADFRAPGRTQIPIEHCEALFLTMPALGSRLGVFGTKIVGVFPGNPQHGLDPIQGAYALFSAEDGLPLSLMDARYLTAIRTAAVSAVATKYMAAPQAERLSVFGTGTQARHHLQTIPLVRSIREARVCGSNTDKSAEFVKLHTAEFDFALLAASAAEAVAEADIICTCTTSKIPVLDGRLPAAGTHINAIGGFQPDARELDDASVRRANIVVDTWEGCLSEAGDLLIPLSDGTLRKEQISGDLSALVRGALKRESFLMPISIFKSVGFALEDVYAAYSAYRTALETGVGSEVEL